MASLSVIIVQKNDHLNLRNTLKSIKAFSKVNDTVKVIVKSYGDADDVATMICNEFAVKLDLHHIISLDESIYHAMNQAASTVKTNYLMFLNAGDVFSSPICNLAPAFKNKPEILKYLVRVENGIVRKERASPVYFLRRMLNHQGLIYSTQVFGDGFHLDNKVTGDLRHIIEDNKYKKIVYVDEILVEYLGGGFAAQTESITNNWQERSLAYKWDKARFVIKFCMTFAAIIRLKIRKNK